MVERQFFGWVLGRTPGENQRCWLATLTARPWVSAKVCPPCGGVGPVAVRPHRIRIPSDGKATLGIARPATVRCTTAGPWVTLAFDLFRPLTDRARPGLSWAWCWRQLWLVGGCVCVVSSEGV